MLTRMIPPETRHYILFGAGAWDTPCNKDASYQAVLGGLRFNGLLSADAPYTSPATRLE